jgi:hypothetical protein
MELIKDIRNYAGLTKGLKSRSTLYDMAETGRGNHSANKSYVYHNPRKSINTEPRAPGKMLTITLPY